MKVNRGFTPPNINAFVGRQLFHDAYNLRPAATELAVVAESSKVIERKRPLFAQVVCGHSAFWGHTMYPTAPPSYRNRDLQIWRGQNIIVCGVRGGLIFDDLTYDQSSFNFFPWDADPACPKVVPIGLEYDVSLAVKVGQPIFLGFNGAHTNYAHWLTDHLTILELYLEHYQSAGVKIALPNNLTKFARKTVELMGITSQDIYWVDRQPILFSELYFVSTFSFDEIPLKYSQSVDRLLHGAGFRGRDSKGHRKLFISRRDATSRPFFNAAALEQTMVEFGFEVLVTGQMTLVEQIECFREASLVVGAHGAGLINAAFCPRDSLLIEIFPEYMLQPHFWSAVSMRGLNYGYVSGTSFDPDTADVTPANAWASPSIAPLQQLKMVLRET